MSHNPRWPGSDPGVQAVSLNLQVTLSHPPGGRLPLLSARPAVTSVAFTRLRQPYTHRSNFTHLSTTRKDERLSYVTPCVPLLTH